MLIKEGHQLKNKEIANKNKKDNSQNLRNVIWKY